MDHQPTWRSICCGTDPLVPKRDYAYAIPIPDRREGTEYISFAKLCAFVTSWFKSSPLVLQGDNTQKKGMNKSSPF